MNCPRCGYLLFGLASARCPECGKPFKTTDWGFPRGAVHFLCPHCSQSYLGTDEFGLPRPRSFTCMKCSQAVHAAEMMVRPLRDGVVGEPLRFGTDWDHRDRIGFFTAFVTTLTQIATQPGEFFRMAYLADRGSAMLFANLTTLVALPLWVGVLALLHALLPGAGLPPVGDYLTLRNVAILVIAASGGVIAWSHLLGAALYLVLRGLRCTLNDFEPPIQIVAFATAVFPALFFPPAVLWYVYVIIAGLRETHELSTARAAIVALLPILALANLAVGLYLL